MDGTDNFEARFLLNDWSLETGTPWVYCGAVGGAGRAMPVFPNQTACLRCVLAEPPPPGETETCDTAGVVLPAVGVAAGLAAGFALKIAGNLPDAAAFRNDPHLLVADAWGGSVRRVGTRALYNSGECPACGGALRDKHARDWLRGGRGASSATLCGRGGVQLAAPPGGAVDLEKLAARWRRAAGDENVRSNRFLCAVTVDRLEPAGPPGEVTVFRDGRTIVTGTTDPARARQAAGEWAGGVKGGRTRRRPAGLYCSIRSRGVVQIDPRAARGATAPTGQSEQGTPRRRPRTPAYARKREEYERIRGEALRMLQGDDEHSVRRQLLALLDNHLTYRTVVRGRELSAEAGRPQSGWVHEMIDRGFVVQQAAAVRRLIDPEVGLGNRAVYSPRRGLEFLNEVRSSLTREVYVCRDGGIYDERDHVAEYRHAMFDGLVDDPDRGRNPADVIGENFADDLKRRLDSAESYKTYVDKRVAHAADPDNRGEATFDYARLEDTYRDLAFVTNRLTVSVFSGSLCDHVFRYQCDVVEGMDEPLCPPQDLDRLRQFRRDKREEIEKIGSDGSRADVPYGTRLAAIYQEQESSR